MRWINIRGHYPPQLGFYLAFIPDRKPSYEVIEFCFEKHKGYHWVDLLGTHLIDNRVTHWMPLPDAPEVEK